MKKNVFAFLILAAMVLSFITGAGAAYPEPTVPNSDVPINATIQVRLAGTTDPWLSFEEAGDLTTLALDDAHDQIEFRVQLDTEPIRTSMKEWYEYGQDFAMFLADGNAQKANEILTDLDYANWPVKGEFTVDVKFPEEFLLDDDIAKTTAESYNMEGFSNDAKDVFIEKSRIRKDDTNEVIIVLEVDQTKAVNKGKAMYDACVAGTFLNDLTLDVEEVKVDLDMLEQNGKGDSKVVGVLNGQTSFGGRSDRDEKVNFGSNRVESNFTRTYKIKGKVTVDEDMDLSNVTLYLFDGVDPNGYNNMHFKQEATCNPDGTYAFDKLPMGYYTLVAVYNDPAVTDAGDTTYGTAPDTVIMPTPEHIVTQNIQIYGGDITCNVEFHAAKVPAADGSGQSDQTITSNNTNGHFDDSIKNTPSSDVQTGTSGGDEVAKQTAQWLAQQGAGGGTTLGSGSSVNVEQTDGKLLDLTDPTNTPTNPTPEESMIEDSQKKINDLFNGLDNGSTSNTDYFTTSRTIGVDPDGDGTYEDPPAGFKEPTNIVLVVEYTDPQVVKDRFGDGKTVVVAVHDPETNADAVQAGRLLEKPTDAEAIYDSRYTNSFFVEKHANGTMTVFVYTLPDHISAISGRETEDYLKDISTPGGSIVGGGGGAGVSIYKVNFNIGGNTDEIAPMQAGTLRVADLPKPKKDGYTFDGWYLDSEMTQKVEKNITLLKDITLYGRWISSTLDNEHHYAYVIGYPDETVRPQNNITREEVAMIFYRLLRDEVRASLRTSSNDFDDVDADRWSNTAISTMANGGYILGYPDGTFKPGNKITRAEFATMATRFASLVEASDVVFTDIEGHWSASYVLKATKAGWIEGYPDNSFRPDAYITRAEAMTIINRVLSRSVDKDGLHADARIWSDLAEKDWYYYIVIEATNSHTFTRKADGITENWTAITANKTWD